MKTTTNKQNHTGGVNPSRETLLCQALDEDFTLYHFVVFYKFFYINQILFYDFDFIRMVAWVMPGSVASCICMPDPATRTKSSQEVMGCRQH